METKVCSKCQIEKDLNFFMKDKSTKSGYTYDCKECRKIKDTKWRKDNPDKIKKKNSERKDERRDFYQSERGVSSSRRTHLKMKYGIELETYEKMYQEQNQLCLICQQPEQRTRNTFLAVDHCHETNVVRGLLCSHCNRALGLFRDSVKILQSAINYLVKHKNKKNDE